MSSGPPRLSDNERLVLDLIRRSEPIRRSQLHARTPLTQPSVHRIVDGLIAKGLVTIGRLVAQGPGKPSPELLLDRSHAYSVGVSVNTDAITLCLADIACEPVDQVRIAGRSHDRATALDLIATEARRMLDDQGATEQQLVGVCLALPAFFVAPDVMNPPQPLHDWGLIDLRAELSRRFAASCYLENNATTGAIGESLVGVGRWAPNLVYLSFNYGFGGGVIIDGRPYVGAHGNAMEIGRLFTDDELSSRPALGLLLEHLDRHGVHVATVDELAERFDPTWEGVGSWVDASLPVLNRAIWAASAVVDPDAIVFGGEIPDALARLLIDRVEPHATQHYRYGRRIPVPALVPSEVPDVGAALGAALVPLKAQLLP